MDRKEKFTKITITRETKKKIDRLAKEKNLKQVTVLEYILSGKISLSDIDG